MDIDIDFDFTTDTPKYWDNFWEQDDVLGVRNNDPDICSKTLQKYHQLLWSKRLPNGEMMDLIIGNSYNYLSWKNFRFGSDSITASFRYKCYRNMIFKVKQSMPNYYGFIENYLRKTYTIGGATIFPKVKGGINQTRGCNLFIRDRWDLTMECIRKYYNNEQSPLFDVLERNRDFFDLFVDFRGYVDFFYMQDCVSSDYKSVIFWLGDGNFLKNPFPKTVDEYVYWINSNIDFVKKRNERIREALMAI